MRDVGLDHPLTEVMHEHQVQHESVLAISWSCLLLLIGMAPSFC